jgi:type IV pilus assembly protein PilO
MHVLDDQTRRFGRVLHYTGALVVVLCATAGYTLAYAPAVERAADTELRINELLLSVENMPVIREHHEKVSATLAEVTRRIAKVRQRVPQHADAGEFLKEVTRIAGEEQVTLKNFQPGQPASKKGYAEIEVTLLGDGSFESVCTFFDRLTKLNRLSKVKSLTISTRDPQTEYPMEVTLVIYFGLESFEVEPRKGVRRG